MIDFSKPIETNTGYPVRVLATGVKSDYSVIVAILYSSNHETVQGFFADGTNYSKTFLKNVAVKREGWINLYETLNSPSTTCLQDRIAGGSRIYKTKINAEKRAHDMSYYVCTVKLEWEE